MGNARWTGVRLRDVLDRAGREGRARCRCASTAWTSRWSPDGAGLPEVARPRPRARWRGHDRLRHERRAVAAAQRFPAAAGRAGLVLDLLGQDAQRHRGAGPRRTTITGWRRPTASPIRRAPASSRARPATSRCRSTGWCRAPSSPTSDRATRSRPARRRSARGIAFGGDTGVARVDLSADGGKTWQPAQLGPDEGKYSFRQWQAEFTRTGAGQPHAAWSAAPTAAAWRSPRARSGTHRASCKTPSKPPPSRRLEEHSPCSMPVRRFPSSSPSALP